MPPGWRFDRRLRCALPSAWQWAANRWDPVSGGGNCGFGLHDFSELRVTANDQTGCTAVIHGARYLPVLGAGRTWVAAGWGSCRSAGLACKATGHERAGWRPRRCRANALAMVVRLVAEGERVGLWGVVAGGVVEGDLVPCPDADDDHVGDGLARGEVQVGGGGAVLAGGVDAQVAGRGGPVAVAFRVTAVVPAGSPGMVRVTWAPAPSLAMGAPTPVRVFMTRAGGSAVSVAPGPGA